MNKYLRDKIEKLKNKQSVLKARIQRIENREKARERKLDTRRKILIGSYFLEQYRNKNNFNELKTIMDKYLTRESDRKLFDLKVQNGILEEKQKTK